MLRYEGKRLSEIAAILSLHKGSITAMCRRYREQGLEEYARNKYQSHRWLLSWERKEEILNQFKNEEAGFGRINKPKRCWCSKGQRPSVPCHHIREYRYAFGAVKPLSGENFFLTMPNCDTVCTNVSLRSFPSNSPTI